MQLNLQLHLQLNNNRVDKQRDNEIFILSFDNLRQFYALNQWIYRLWSIGRIQFLFALISHIKSRICNTYYLYYKFLYDYGLTCSWSA